MTLRKHNLIKIKIKIYN